MFIDCCASRQRGLQPSALGKNGLFKQQRFKLTSQHNRFAQKVFAIPTFRRSHFFEILYKFATYAIKGLCSCRYPWSVFFLFFARINSQTNTVLNMRQVLHSGAQFCPLNKLAVSLTFKAELRFVFLLDLYNVQFSSRFSISFKFQLFVKNVLDVINRCSS